MKQRYYDMEKEKALFRQWEQEEMMSETETTAYFQEKGEGGFLVVCEERENPLHDPFCFPKRWHDRKELRQFRGLAQPGEWYTMQLGVYGGDCALELQKIGWTGNFQAPLCLNEGGIDCSGKPFLNTVTVKKNRVQPLWLGFDIPADFQGSIEGALTVCAAGKAPVTVAVHITVSGEMLEDRGDREPWRHSRLRWLNSKIGIDDGLTAPFTPLRVAGNQIMGLGHRLTLSADGLPEQVESFFTPSVDRVSLKSREVLTKKATFTVTGEKGEEEILVPCHVTEKNEGVVRWEAKKRAGHFLITTKGFMEFDGYVCYDVEVETLADCCARNIALSLPYRSDAASYWMGLGKLGGLRQGELDWKWDESLNQDTLWMGDVNAGLMLRLKDEHYEKPHMLIYYHYHPLRLPDCWYNGGKGGVSVTEMADGVMLRAQEGERLYRKGERRRFLFDLAITPVKPIDKKEHWQDHYYHAVPSTAEEWKKLSKSGANILNIHHGHEQNPYINYPFFETQKLAKLVDDAHRQGCRAKLYYTIKEMTIHMTEFFAMNSLNEEIFPSTYETGLSFQGSIPYADEWLKRMLKTDYMTAWRQKINHGSYQDELEASVVTAPMSRLNNYFLEGLRWLLEETGMDGLYFDDVAFDRSIMKRIRKILDRDHPGCSIDLHSWNYYKNNTVDNSRLAGWGNSMNLYIDNFAFIDRIWFGEGFDYDVSPDSWLIEMSGIPFGMMGEMLQNGGNIWRGMVFGMTNRLPNENDPSGIWALWREFGIGDAVMEGYWHPDCPVKTGDANILATVYRKAHQILIALGSWDKHQRKLKLQIDYEALGFDPARCVLETPEIPGFQEKQNFTLQEGITVPPGGGWVMLLTEEEPAEHGTV